MTTPIRAVIVLTEVFMEFPDSFRELLIRVFHLDYCGNEVVEGGLAAIQEGVGYSLAPWVT